MARDGRLLGIAAGDLSAFLLACLASREEGRYQLHCSRMEDAPALRFLLFFLRVSGVLTVVLSLPFLLASLTPSAPPGPAGEDWRRDLLVSNLRRGPWRITQLIDFVVKNPETAARDLSPRFCGE